MSQRQIDAEEQLGRQSGVRCPVCNKSVPEFMGRHIGSAHGAKELQKYLDAKRCVTPSDYKSCRFCGKILHRRSLTKHLGSVHAKEVTEANKGSTLVPAIVSPIPSKPAVEQATTATVVCQKDERSKPRQEGGMDPPMHIPKKKKNEEPRLDKDSSQRAGTSDRKNYPMGQVYDAVRAMLNHRGTESYTRDKVYDTCRREMPQLSEFECDLATDFSIAAAREVASLSQYAAAYRNLNPGPEYRDALEQIVTLARGPKIETGYLESPIAMQLTRSVYPVKSYKPESAFKSVQRYERVVQPEAPQPDPLTHSLPIMCKDVNLQGFESEVKSLDECLGIVRDDYRSNTGSTSGSESPLMQFIRSLRTESELGDPASEITSESSVANPNLASTDSEAISSAQPYRKTRAVEQSNQRNFKTMTEDEEIEHLMTQRNRIEKDLEQDLLNDLKDFEDDSQEFSQTF